MKRLLTTLVTFSLLAALPGIANANPGWTDYVSVSELTVTGSKQYVVRLNLHKNPSGCKSSDTFYLDQDAYGAEMMFMLLQDAVVYNKNVRVFVTGGCEINGYAEISKVSIVP